VTLDNRQAPEHGAIVRISWAREVFESMMPSGQSSRAAWKL